MNGKETKAVKDFYREHITQGDLIMKTLKLAGWDDRLIDFVSDGLWSQRQKMMGKEIKIDSMGWVKNELSVVEFEILTAINKGEK